MLPPPYYIALGNRNSRNPGDAAGRGMRELTWYPHLTTCMWDTWSVRAGSTMHLHCMMKFYVERFPGSGTASTAAARYSVALQPPRAMAACCGDTVSRRSWLDRAERDTCVPDVDNMSVHHVDRHVTEARRD